MKKLFPFANIICISFILNAPFPKTSNDTADRLMTLLTAEVLSTNYSLTPKENIDTRDDIQLNASLLEFLRF